MPWHSTLALAFPGAWPNGVTRSFPGVVFPSCKNSPEFQRLQKFQPLIQACLFSLGPSPLTNLLLCLLEIGDTFLTKWEARCLMEPSKEVRTGAFLEQTRLTLHHNLQAEMNHGLQIAVGTVTRAICIRPSLNNRLGPMNIEEAWLLSALIAEALAGKNY